MRTWQPIVKGLGHTHLKRQFLLGHLITTSYTVQDFFLRLERAKNLLKNAGPCSSGG